MPTDGKQCAAIFWQGTYMYLGYLKIGNEIQMDFGMRMRPCFICWRVKT